MNKDQIKGSVKDAAGRLQRKAGAATGSSSQQLKGLATQAEGKAQKAVGDIKHALKDKRSR